jgi:hypothetical protein
MDQTSWNLCPQQTPFSGDCYFDSDVQFDSIKGEQHVTIDDAPDGSWDLLVKRDIFDKVGGAGGKGQQRAGLMPGRPALLPLSGEWAVAAMLLWDSLCIGVAAVAAAS